MPSIRLTGGMMARSKTCCVYKQAFRSQQHGGVLSVGVGSFEDFDSGLWTSFRHPAHPLSVLILHPDMCKLCCGHITMTHILQYVAMQ